MKHRIPGSSLIFLLMVLFTSCEKDLDITADWEDISIIYGILDQSEQTQYVRVNKAYLGEGNALVMATEPDSIVYPEGALEVLMEIYVDGSLVETVEFERTDIEVDPGVFAINQVVYKYDAPFKPGHVLSGGDTLWLVNEDQQASAQFKLIVKNNQSGKVATAWTGLVENHKFDGPATVTFFNELRYFQSSSGQYLDQKFEWTSQPGAARYKVELVFNYYVMENGEPVPKHLDWNSFSTIRTSSTSGGTELNTLTSGQSFYSILTSTFSDQADVVKYPGKPDCDSCHFDIKLLAANTSLDKYLETNQATGGLVQDKLTYTNIENGYGIWGSRYIYTEKDIELDSDSRSKLFSLELGFQPAPPN